jgi:WW domain-containing oxidoreductase
MAKALGLTSNVFDPNNDIPDLSGKVSTISHNHEL